jgi:hypothetical protein
MEQTRMNIEQLKESKQTFCIVDSEPAQFFSGLRLASWRWSVGLRSESWCILSS